MYSSHYIMTIYVQTPDDFTCVWLGHDEKKLFRFVYLNS